MTAATFGSDEPPGTSCVLQPEVVMDTIVRKNPNRPRYELVEDGHVVGVADFRDHGDRLVFDHTEIVRPLRGTGRGERLVRAALDDVRSEGKTVVPSCWFVAEFIDLNPDYKDLLAS